MSSLLLRSVPAVASITNLAGAYNVDPDNISGDADGTGNGILVGETGQTNGSDSGLAGTGAWTLAQFHTQLEAGAFSPLDVILLWDANYAPAAQVDVAGGGANTGHGGNKIIIRPRLGNNSVLIDYRTSAGLGVTDVDVNVAGSGSGVHHMDSASNYQWGDASAPPITIYGSGTGIWGNTSGGGHDGCAYINIHFRDAGLGAIHAGNGGVVKVESNTADILIRGFQVIDGAEPSFGGDNAGLIWWLGPSDLRIENSIIASGGSGYPLQNKRLGDASISNSVIYRTDGGRCFKGERCNNHSFDNCIFTAPADFGAINLADDVTTQVRDSSLSITQCTIVQTDGTTPSDTISIAMGVQLGSGNDPAGTGQGNTIRGNIMGGAHVGYVGSSPTYNSYTHGTDMENNQHFSTSQFREFSATLFTDLADFVANATGFSGSHSQNSIDNVTPTFNTLDPYDPTTYAVTNEQTLGGINPGADVTLVGPAAIGL